MRAISNVLIVLHLVLLTTLPTKAGERAGPLSPAAVPEELTRFVARTEPWVRRYLGRLDPQSMPNARVDEERLAEATKNSVAWIRAVLKDRFVPDDIESRVEGFPAGILGVPAGGPKDRAPPVYDCTVASFEAQGYRFFVTQASFSIACFVVPLAGTVDRPANTPDGLARTINDRGDDIFQHWQASLYVRALRLTDFGVELAVPWEAWYSDERRWKSTVLTPPKACEDGIVDATSSPGFVGSPELGKKLRELDPSLPMAMSDSDISQHWWMSVYAATDGKVMVYVAGKTKPGQSPNADVPDWFRSADGETSDVGGSKAGQARSRTVSWPPR